MVGETRQLTVTTDPSGAEVTYASSDESVATVSSAGLIMAVGKGEATITVTATKDEYDAGSADVRVVVLELPKPAYIDVPLNHWAASMIAELSQKGIIGGYPDGSFKPGNNITRAEFTKILAGAIGLTQETPAAPTYNDVAPGTWYYGYVEAAAKAGLVKGDGTGAFRPNAKITRQEIAIILIRAMEKESAAKANASLQTSFSDDQGIASWARGYVVIAVQEGLINGYPGDNTFRPKNNATRAEACTMIYRFMEKQ